MYIIQNLYFEIDQNCKFTCSVMYYIKLLIIGKQIYIIIIILYIYTLYIIHIYIIYITDTFYIYSTLCLLGRLQSCVHASTVTLRHGTTGCSSPGIDILSEKDNHVRRMRVRTCAKHRNMCYTHPQYTF